MPAAAIHVIELTTQPEVLAALLLECEPPHILSPHSAADSAKAIAKGLREGTWEASVEDIRGDGDNVRVSLRPKADAPDASS